MADFQEPRPGREPSAEACDAGARPFGCQDVGPEAGRSVRSSGKMLWVVGICINKCKDMDKHVYIHIDMYTYTSTFSVHVVDVYMYVWVCMYVLTFVGTGTYVCMYVWYVVYWNVM